jgi:hypothetical protein
MWRVTAYQVMKVGSCWLQNNLVLFYTEMLSVLQPKPQLCADHEISLQEQMEGVWDWGSPVLV